MAGYSCSTRRFSSWCADCPYAARSSRLRAVVPNGIDVSFSVPMPNRRFISRIRSLAERGCLLLLVGVLVASCAAQQICAPAVPCPKCADSSSALPAPRRVDLSWLLQDKDLILTIRDHRREGYGADFFRRELEIHLRPDAPATGLSTQVAVSHSGNRGASRSVDVPTPLTTDLLRVLANASPPSPKRTNLAMITRSDTYVRTEIRVRTSDDSRSVEFFTHEGHKSPLEWRLRGENDSPAIDAEELNRVYFDRLKPLLEK